jgi:hypothetical protein
MPTNFNEFTLTELDSNAIPFPKTITIPIGNYNKINLASKLSTLLTTASTFGVIYTVTNPSASEPDTFRFTFTATNIGSIGGISFTLDDTSPFRQLGFEANSTNTFSLSGGNLVLISTNAINLAFVLRAYIKSNIVQNSTDGILEEILSIGSYPTSSLVYYQQYNFDMNTREFNTSSVNSWQFVLVDGFDQEIDLNGISFAFSVAFYTRNVTHELHKTELNIRNEERLFQIEQQQRRLENEFAPKDKDKETNLSTFNGLQLNDVKRNPLDPIFPVQAFTSGFAFQEQPEIIYPK